MVCVPTNTKYTFTCLKQDLLPELNLGPFEHEMSFKFYKLKDFVSITSAYCNTYGVVSAISARGVANQKNIVPHQELGLLGKAYGFCGCQSHSHIHGGWVTA